MMPELYWGLGIVELLLHNICEVPISADTQDTLPNSLQNFSICSFFLKLCCLMICIQTCTFTRLDGYTLHKNMSYATKYP